MKHLIMSLLMAATPMVMAAQHNLHPNMQETQRNEAQYLLDEQHDYGAGTTHGIQGKKALPEAEQLIADYWLLQPDTEARMAEWLQQHPVHPLTSRIALMRASLLVREARYREALSLYNATPIDNLPANELSEARLYESIASIHTGQVQRAEQVLESIVNSETHGMDVQYYLGYVHYLQGHYREALPCLTAASASYDYRRSAPVLLADCQVQEGHFADALQTLRLWRRTTGATMLAAEADRIEGEALYGVHHYDEAIAPLKHYVQAVAEPSRTALYKLGMSQLQTENYDEAALHLSRSAGTARDAMSQSAWLHAGIAYIQTAQKQRARMAFQQASEMDFDPKVQEEALYNYALTLHDSGDMGFGESVSVFERFLNTFPQSKHQQSVTQHLAEVYLSTRNYQAALTSINKIRQPSAEMLEVKRQLLYNLGAQYFAQGAPDVALDYLSQSIAIRPTAEAYYWRGESEYGLHRYAQAADDLRRGTQSTQYRLPATYALGYALLKQKQYAEALPQFITVANSTADAPLRADAFNRMGDCQFATRLYDAAYSSYQHAIDTDRSSGDYALLQQAFIQGLRGNYQKKTDLLAQFDTQYGSTSLYAADALYEKGRAYVQTGQRQQASDTFAALRQRFPQTQQARKAANEQAMLLHDAGRTDEAIAAFRSVIQEHPRTAEAQTALANLKDIYTSKGRVNDYAALAAQAGQAVSPNEMDEMVMDAALRAYSEGNLQQALNLYRQLEAQTLNSTKRQTAILWQMKSAERMQNHSLIVETATRLLATGRMDAKTQSEARLARAKAYMAMGNTDKGVADLQVVSKDKTHGPEATVLLAQYAYDTQQYQAAEQVLTPLIDGGCDAPYWLARAFIILSDVCAKTGRDVEARQYLLSLRSNYTASEEINNMIQQRLSQLK